MKHFAPIVALVLIFDTVVAQTPNAPVVVSPVNLCWNSPASPLTAQGTNLEWISPVSSSVGGSDIFTSSTFVDNSSNNKRTFFTTKVNNVKITSVDYTKKGNSGALNKLKIGIFDASGKIIATSNTTTTINPSISVKITNDFDFTLSKAGQYSIGVVSGSGNIGFDPSSTYPISESTGAIEINSATGGYRAFNDIKFEAEVSSSTAPTPSTEIAGSFNYYVTQTVNGKKSSPATIKVNVKSTPAPTVVSPISICQGSSTPLTAVGTNLKWVSSLISSVGGSSLFTNATYVSSEGDNNKKTLFKTFSPNTTLTSVDYTVPGYQQASGVKLGLYDANNNLIATSDLKTTQASAGSAVKVTAIFNYTISSPGEYSIGLNAGTGNLGYENTAFPLTEPTQSLSIIGATNSSVRVFNNFQFTVAGTEYSSTAPTPASINAGISTFYVTQTVNGCESAPAIITVNVSGIISTTAGVTCSGSTATLSAIASDGYTLNWYNSATGGSSLRTGNTYTTSNLTKTTTYYVVASKGSCSTGRIPVQAIVGGFTRKEYANSTSWSDPNNWVSCNGGYPQNGADASIPETTREIILTENIILNNLIIQGNSKLNLNGFTLTVSSVSGTGFITGTKTSKLIIKATTNSTLRFDQTNPGTTNTLNSLTVNNNSYTITLANPLVATGVVDITGSSTLLSNGNLTLEATATSNANIASLANGGSIKGNVKVQNYFTGGDLAYRSFRTISSPVHDVSSPKGYKIAGYKSTMYVTGAGGVANGFDASPNNGATIKFYNEPKKASQNQYITAANTSEVITQGKGIYFYFRGKKNAAPGNKFVKNAKGKYDSPENVLMEYLGEINSGTISPVISFTNHAGETSTNGFNLIGNPYPSVIDWNKVATSKIDKTIWVQKQDGNFAVYNGETGTNGGSQFILPGQGFFVKANATGASVTFTENSKAALNAPETRLMNVKETSILNMNGENAIQENKSERLSKVGIMLTKDEFSSDETVLVFRSSNSDLYDDNDINYQGEGAVSLTSVTADKKYLAINYMSQVKELTEVVLYAGFNETGTYSLSLSDLTAMDNVAITLKDNYSKKMIDLKSTKNYEFEVDNSIAASFGEKRFSLLFQAPVALPVNLLTFTAAKADQGVQLKWTTETERNSAYFDVEQSTDGKAFYSLGRVNAARTSSAQSNYNFLDKNPLTGINYYRLKHTDTEGKFSYSDVISVNYSLQSITAATVTVYPNPAANEIRVNVNGSSEAVSQLNIYNIEGKKVLSGNQAYMDITSLTNGMYIVETLTGDNSILLEKCKIIKN